MGVNVILLLIDTLRRDHLTPYGGRAVPTPAFAELAAMGTTFDRCFLGSFPCMPARRDLWTGRYEFPWRGWGPLLPTDRDLPSVLTAAGVRTMLITDHYHMFQPGSGNYHFGFAGWEFIRGQEDDHWFIRDTPVPWPAERERKLHRRWERYWWNTADRRRGLLWRSEEDTFAARTMKTAMDWLQQTAGAREPFFLLIECFDPHEPFDPPEPYRSQVGAPLEGGIPWPIYGAASRYSEGELAGIRALYAGEVALVDAWLGRLLDTCRRLGRLQDTMIIVTTDHGYLFGEHGMIGKPSAVHGDSNVYRPLAHVPLFIYHPAAAPGQRRPELAQWVDLYPTVLDAIGVAEPRDVVLHGRSLLPWILGTAQGTLRSYACYGKFGEAIQITDGELVLHQWPVGQDNTPLYWYGSEPPAFLRPRSLGAPEPWPAPALVRYPVDWVRGPCQSVLLDAQEAGDLQVAHPEELQRLRGALREWLQAVQAPPEQLQRLGL